MHKYISLLGAILLCIVVPASARPGSPRWLSAPVGSERSAGESLLVPHAGEKTARTRHQITVNGQQLSYTVTAGFLPLRNPFRQTKAEIFYVAYKVYTAASSPRPLTFLWGGGPGSPSDLLQLGGLGPWRGRLADEIPSLPLSDRLVPNENTWLTFTDLVFVDPVGTGYSYALNPEDQSRFWNVQGDIDSVAEFIRVYLTHYNAWKAPLFILGESYGTLRAAGVAEDLVLHHVPLKGVILISPVLNFQLTHFGPLNDLPYVLILPSYTAAAFAHKKLGPDLQASLLGALHKAQGWATTDYALALMKGDQLSAEQRDAVAARLAQFTGLTRRFILKNNLRITDNSFADQLLADKHELVARYDTRLSYPGRPGPYNVVQDSSIVAMDRATRPFLDYLRTELGFRSDAYYAGPFGGAWPYVHSSNPYAAFTEGHWNFGRGVVDTSHDLARAMQLDPNLHVFVASGYFDLSTPFFSAEYTFNHMGLDAKLRKNVVLARYLGGHAMYLVKQVRPRLKSDVAAFLRAAMAALPTPIRGNEFPVPGQNSLSVTNRDDK